jgi:hypothetical protein
MEYIIGFSILIVTMIAIATFMKKRYNINAKEAPKGEMGDGDGHGMGDGDGEGGGGDGGGN